MNPDRPPTHEDAPFDISAMLLQPPSQEPWQPLSVRADHLKQADGDWAKIKLLLPGIHVVGMSPDGQHCEVAVDPSYIP